MDSRYVLQFQFASVLQKYFAHFCNIFTVTNTSRCQIPLNEFVKDLSLNNHNVKIWMVARGISMISDNFFVLISISINVDVIASKIVISSLLCKENKGLFGKRTRFKPRYSPHPL